MAFPQAQIDALSDVSPGQTLAEAGGIGHSAVENNQNAALRALAEFVDAEGPVTSVNGETGAVTLDADDVAAVPAASGFVYREYDGGWPERGTVPSGTIVCWIKRNPADPDPTIGGTGAADGVDIALLAQA